MGEPFAAPQYKSCYKGSDPGGNVHDRTAGKVKQSHLLQPSASPYPVGYGTIDHDQPQRRKEALRRTLERRPDLIETAHLSSDDYQLLDEIKEEQ